MAMAFAPNAGVMFSVLPASAPIAPAVVIVMTPVLQVLVPPVLSCIPLQFEMP